MTLAIVATVAIKTTTTIGITTVAVENTSTVCVEHILFVSMDGGVCVTDTDVAVLVDDGWVVVVVSWVVDGGFMAVVSWVVDGGFKAVVTNGFVVTFTGGRQVKFHLSLAMSNCKQ